MGELVSLLPIIAIFAIFYLLMIRPASKRQKALREMQRSLEVGDRVLTQSGIVGVIQTFEGDLVRLQIADGVVVTVIRPAVAGLAGEVLGQQQPEEAPEQDG